jgi:hypothetical protein
MDADVGTSQPVGVEEVARRVGELTDAAFVLAAVSDALRPDTSDLTEEHGRVLAELGMAVRREPGGRELVPPLAGLPDRVRRGLAWPGAHAHSVTAAPERSPLSCRRAAAARQSVEAIRAAAGTAALVALIYDHVAFAAEHAAGAADATQRHRDRVARVRRLAAEERRDALRMWARAAALESAVD